MCDNALARGINSDNAKGKLKKWLDRKSKPGAYMMCYQDLAFVFSDKNECITVLNIPKAVH